jgi:hypothetical protein
MSLLLVVFHVTKGNDVSGSRANTIAWESVVEEYDKIRNVVHGRVLFGMRGEMWRVNLFSGV